MEDRSHGFDPNLNQVVYITAMIIHVIIIIHHYNVLTIITVLDGARNNIDRQNNEIHLISS